MSSISIQLEKEDWLEIKILAESCWEDSCCPVDGEQNKALVRFKEALEHKER